MESRLLLLVALIFISPLHGWKITYLPLWTVFTVLWATLLRKKLCQFFLLVIPQKAEWINGFTSPSAEGSSNCLLPVPCAALRQEWSMKPSSWTALEKHHWLSQAENTENNHQHHLSGLCGFQREGDKHEQQEMKAIQWQSKPRRVLCFSIQPHLEPSCWNAVVEPVLLHIMARLCLCDAQVFGFIAAPCPQLGIFFFFSEGIMNSCSKEREKTLCRGTEPALDVLITWLALYILWCKSWGRCVQQWALCPAAGTWHRADGGTPHFACVSALVITMPAH